MRIWAFRSFIVFFILFGLSLLLSYKVFASINIEVAEIDLTKPELALESDLNKLADYYEHDIEKLALAIVQKVPNASVHQTKFRPYNTKAYRIGLKHKGNWPWETFTEISLFYQGKLVKEGKILARVYKHYFPQKRYKVEEESLKLDESTNWHDMNNRLKYVIKLYDNDFEKVHKRILEDNPKVSYKKSQENTMVTEKVYGRPADINLWRHFYVVQSGIFIGRIYTLIIEETEGVINYAISEDPWVRLP